MTARVFVATGAPQRSAMFPGMSPGRWYEASPGTWEEKKEDGTTTQWSDEGPTGTSGSKTLRLKREHDGAICEVFITMVSALKFVNGAFSGEFLGSWEVGGVPQAPPVERQVAVVEGPPTVPRRSHFESDAGLGGGNKAGALGPPPAPAGKPRPKKAVNCDQTPEMVNKLYDAAKSGDYASTKRYLDLPVDPDCISSEGQTPLIMAAQNGKVQIVEMLIQAGADVNIGVNGNTPMIAAFQKGRKDVLRVLFGAAFQTLEHAVGPGGQAVADYSAALNVVSAADEEVSPMAMAELRDVTAKLATMNRPQEKDDEIPQIPAEDEPVVSVQDNERMREDLVRETMRGLISANRMCES